MIAVPSSTYKSSQSYEYNRPWLYPKQFNAFFTDARYSFIEASPQPLDAMIQTPEGPKQMGDIQVGDTVFAIDGSPTQVEGIYPRGVESVYRITLTDGSWAEATLDHRWLIKHVQRESRILTTKQIRDFSESTKKLLRFPVSDAVQYSEKNVPLDPWMLGILLGDGSISKNVISLSTADEWIANEIQKIVLPHYEVKEDLSCSYRYVIKARNPYAARTREMAGIRERSGGFEVTVAGTYRGRFSDLAQAQTCRNTVVREHYGSEYMQDDEKLIVILDQLGLRKSLHDTKFIPAVYKYNSVEVRQAILSGLIDSDGSCPKQGAGFIIEQTSKQLAYDIQEIVQSLGGLCRVTEQSARQYGWKPSYRCNFRLPGQHQYARLPRKRERWDGTQSTLARSIKSVEYVGEKPVQCIAIDHPSHLYLTDNYLATHNTKSGKSHGGMVWLFEQAILGKDGYNYWWVAPIMAQARIMYRRLKRALPSDVFRANDTEMTLSLINGAVIWFKGSDHPDSLYGEDVYAAVIDEASRAKEDSYYATRSTLTATGGKLRCIGNVRGKKNWFFRECRRAEAGNFRNGEFHRITAEDAVEAGVFPKEELEDAEAAFAANPEGFQQLYGAIAADDGGNPFGQDAIDACVGPMSNKMPVAFGVDLAKSQDWTVIIGLDQDGVVCVFKRFQRDWNATAEEVADTIGSVPTKVDATGVGSAVIEQIQSKVRSDTVEGLVFTAPSKQGLMANLRTAISRNGITFPEGPISDELDNFEYQYTSTGVRYCLAPETKVLTSDLLWIPIGDVKTGDNLLGFDEHPSQSNKTRRWGNSIVESAETIQLPCYRLILDDGTEVISSSNHLWLVDTGNGPLEWKSTEELRAPHPTSKSLRYVPSRLVRLLDVWESDTSYQAGYLAGAFDGEGHLAQTPKKHPGHSFRVSMAQRENEMFEQVQYYLDDLNFNHKVHMKNGDRDVFSIEINGRRPNVLKFLGRVRPPRLLSKFDPDKLGVIEAISTPKVVAKEFLGERDVIALQTSTFTFVAEGLASHNSAPSGHHDDCVMALALAVSLTIQSESAFFMEWL